MKKFFTKKVAMAIVIPLVVIGALCFAYFWGEYSKSIPIKDYGHAFLNVNKLYSVMKVNSSMVGVDELLCELDADDKLQIAGSSMKYRGEELNIKLPCFFDSNNYIFIADKEASFITSELRNETIDGRIFYIKNSIYDDEYVKLSDRDDLLLRCNENLFLALKPFEIVSSGESVKVSVYDFLLIDGYAIYKATVWDDSIEHSTHGLYEGSIVKIDGKSYSMGTFLDILGVDFEGNAKEVDEEDIVVKTIDETMKTIPEATYQYFLGYRYEYPENLTVYAVDGQWYQSREDFTSPVQSIPIYYAPKKESGDDFFDEDYDESQKTEDSTDMEEFVPDEDVLNGKKGVYLPSEYVLVDPLNSKQYKTPAFAKVYHSMGETIVTDGTALKNLEFGVLYDGDENYFFAEPVTVRFGDKVISVSALSYMSIEGGNKISIYDFERDEFSSYIINTDNIKIELSYNCVIDAVGRKVRKDGKDLMILGSDPSLYGSYFE